MPFSQSGPARWITRQLRSPASGLVWVFVVFIVIPSAVAISYGDTVSDKFIICMVTMSVLLMIAEVIFRFGYRLYFGGSYRFVPGLPIENMYVESHPYLPFVCKRNFKRETPCPANYPLHKGRFSFGSYTSNNFGFLNGPTGNRDVAIPKPTGLFRVNCIGASTTGNYIEYDKNQFSYPMELERILQSKMHKLCEVNNFGQGGYNSADILVRFALQIIDTDPDVVVIYHAYNDIRDYLTAGFESDYSHSRINLGKSYWKFYLAARIPHVPLKFINGLVNLWLPFNIRNTLIDQISKGRMELSADALIGMSAYERNLQHVIDICRCNGIKVVLSTFCFFLYGAIKNEPMHQLFESIVSEENEVIRRLSAKNGVALVDNEMLVPHDERYFVDSIHFTPEGMRLIASNISEVVLKTCSDA